MEGRMPFGFIGFAGVLLAASALLHAFAFTVTGFTSEALLFIVIGLIWGAIAWGLWRGWRWLAWIAFVVVLIGMLAAYIRVGGSTIPDWWLMLMVFSDLSVAACLFIALWRRRT